MAIDARLAGQIILTSMFALQFQIEALYFFKIDFFIPCNKFNAPKQIKRVENTPSSQTQYTFIYWPMGEV